MISTSGVEASLYLLCSIVAAAAAAAFVDSLPLSSVSRRPTHIYTHTSLKRNQKKTLPVWEGKIRVERVKRGKGGRGWDVDCSAAMNDNAAAPRLVYKNGKWKRAKNDGLVRKSKKFLSLLSIASFPWASVSTSSSFPCDYHFNWESKLERARLSFSYLLPKIYSLFLPSR